VSDAEAWQAAGRWDSDHGLMPMATFHLTSDQRVWYAAGYHSSPTGLRFLSNPYREAERPED